MKKTKFNKGDYILIKISSSYIGKEIWVGAVEHIDDGYYYVRTVNLENLHKKEFTFRTKVPFQFDPMMDKIEPNRIEATLKAIELLYY